MATLFSHDWSGSQDDPWDSGVWSFVLAGTPTAAIHTNQGDATGRGGITGVATDRAIAHLVTPVNTAPTGIRVLIRPANGGGGHHYFFARATGTFSDDDPEDGYRIQIAHAANTVTMRRYISGSSFTFTAGAFTTSPNTDFWLYWEVFEDGGSTTLRWRMWADGDPEPETWGQELSDSQAGRPSSGSIGLAYTPGASTLGVFDDMTVTDLATGAETGAAELTASGDMTAAGTATGGTVTGAAELSASGDMTAIGTEVGGTVTGAAELSASGDMTAAGTASGSATYLEISTGVMLNTRYSVSSFTNGWFYTTTLESPTVNDWEPTYGDTNRYKASVQGLLMNIRAANAIFEDEGSDAYVDVGAFNEETNKDNFIAALDSYNDHGVIALTVSLQGGNPGTSGTNPYGETGDGAGGGHVISAFSSDGSLKGIGGTTLSDYRNPTAGTWASRLKDICDATKDRGMFLVLNIFYQRQDQEISNWTGLQNAITQTVRFMVANNYRHILYDVANEYDNAGFDHAGIEDSGTSGDTSASQTQAGLIQYTQEAHAAARTFFSLSASDWRAPTGTSSATFGKWIGGVPHFADVAFPHGNEVFDGLAEHGAGGDSSVNDTATRITKWRTDWESAVGSGNAGPIVMNEDDNSRYERTGGTTAQNGYFGQFNVDLELHALNDCLNNDASWGLMHRWYMQYTGQPAAGFDTESPDYWKWAEGASATPDGDSADIYLSAVLDLYDDATRSTSAGGAVEMSAAATMTVTGTAIGGTVTGSAILASSGTLTASGSAAGGIVTGSAVLSAIATLVVGASGPSLEVLIISATGSENVIPLTGDEVVAKKHNIEIPLNADIILEVTIDGEGNIDGQTFSGSIVSIIDQSVVVATGTPVVHDSTNRIVRWTITDTQLAAGSGNVPSTSNSRYLYGIWRADSGNEYPVVYGQAKFLLIPGS